MDFLFGRRKTPAELLRQNQRALNKAIRELDRERARMEAQEKKIIADIKNMAKKNQMVPGFLDFRDSVKVMAKDLVRTRRYVKKFIMMKANIQAVSLKVQTLKSQDAMASAMKGVTKAMQSMNRQLNLPQIQKIMMEFEKQSEIMDMKEEVMGDAIDDALGDAGDEEESDQIVNQVLDELGIQMGEEMAGLPSAAGGLNAGGEKVSGRQAVAAGGGGGHSAGGNEVDDDLQARLDQLRRE
ncbi:Protein CBR-VPS-2 [Caenorhabditis briggsae]|uniref:Protein CBR-VPS-2 n=1 Tax=Caenorhabditis briggsae TaxID=6238 RepID=A8X558_CAEBR|nr:Protein CBR-VPS-2 [Caenorhabditis briggsae]CAP27833.2 Protein CBR-VPS-2 [Caenorhabditis briggsae]